MRLRQLELRAFRNFSEAAVVIPKKGLLAAVAPNATGKTNFLEAVVMALRGRSWRASHGECVRWGEEAFQVTAEVERREGESEVVVRYHAPAKKMRIEEDGRPVSSVTFYKRYPLVLFVAEDTFLFTRSPAQRRNFLNQVLVTAPPYVSALVQYQRALLQRNASLKEATSPADITAWTELVVEHGVALWRYRQQLVDYLQAHLAAGYKLLTGEQLSLDVELAAPFLEAAPFREALQAAFSSEQRLGYTLRGPHRDDLRLTSDGKPVGAVLSQGQMRGVVLALKLAVASFIEALAEEPPLILLDEVLSELDEQRQQTLLAHLPDAQVLLTGTSVPEALRQQPDVHLLDIRSILAKPATAQPRRRQPEERSVPVKQQEDEAVVAAD